MAIMCRQWQTKVATGSQKIFLESVVNVFLSLKQRKEYLLKNLVINVVVVIVLVVSGGGDKDERRNSWQKWSFNSHLLFRRTGRPTWLKFEVFPAWGQDTWSAA